MELVKPTIGRIVHYILKTGEHRPAIIVRVWPGEYGNDEVKDGINVQILLDGGNDKAALRPPAGQEIRGVMGRVTEQECATGSAWRTSVRYDGTGLMSGSWHWPER